MTTATDTIQYAVPTESSSVLQLRESDDGTIRIIFGVWPMWTYALGIAINSVAAMMQALVLFYLSKIIFIAMQMGPPGASLPVSFWGLFFLTMLFHFGITLIYGGIALLQWYRLYRWGRMPRTLTATSSGLTLSQMGWFAPSHRFWPADQIASVELSKLTEVFSDQQSVALLRIQLRNKWFRRSYRLKSKDAQLPTHIAERLAATLGCPLRVRGGGERSLNS